MGCCLPTNDAAAASAMDMRDSGTVSHSQHLQNNKVPEQPAEQDLSVAKTSKVIFMGDANVGKTSIIKSFVDNTSMRNKKKDNTKVIEDFTKVISVQDKNNQTHLLKLNIWDAAGDAAVHNLAHLFLHDAKVGILCYSIDNKKSFDQLSEWYEHLQEKSEEMFIVIVGSKNDLS